MEKINPNVGEPVERWQISEVVDSETEKVGGRGSSLTVNSMESDLRSRGRNSGRSLSK